MTIEQAFEKLLVNKINLSQPQITQGSRSHQHIRELLDNKWRSNERFPWLVDGDFLSGSYARGTKISPLDDIDVMMILDGHGLVPLYNGIPLEAEVRGNGYAGSPIIQHFNASGHIDSTSVLRIFQEALRDTYPNSTIRKDEQAVNIKLDSYGLGLDIVPCFHIVPRDGSQDMYYIPMGRGDGRWKNTNPKIDEEISNLLHARHNEMLKPVVKLLKYWNRLQNGDCLRSYHVEVLAWYVFDSHPGCITDYAGAVKYFLEKAPALLNGRCPDPTRMGDDIDAYLSMQDRESSIKNMQQAFRIVSQTPLSPFIASANHMGPWRRLFGEAFGQ